jgi:hypothetical protein
MNQCMLQHRYDPAFHELPDDQGGAGRHRCAGCAYELGVAQEFQRAETLKLELDSIPSSQAGTVRHKSPHAAWALGYLERVRRSYAI